MTVEVTVEVRVVVDGDGDGVGEGVSDRARLDHERLDVYRSALRIARWAAGLTIPFVRRHLRDQLIRAADSIVLNIAEGSGSQPGDARRNHFRIAAGSTAEVAAIIDLLGPRDAADRKEELRILAAMLVKLSRR